MRIRATHSGHCQACGRLQKLPNGVLSLHGYSVQHGFFSGVCRGAKHLPFEQSCALIPTLIDAAQSRLRDAQAFVMQLNDSMTRAAWVSNYEGVFGRNRYRMRHVTIYSEVVTSGSVTYNRFYYRAPGPNGTTHVKHYINEYSYGVVKTPVELAARINAYYALLIKDRDVRNLTRYIDWQTQRVATWTAAPLLPVKTTDDRQGFTLDGDDVMPTEARS